MGTSEVITSKEENYKKLKLIEEGKILNKYGNGKSKLKICCISDTHEQHERLKMQENIDILIYAGDFTNWKTSKENSVNSFLNWFKNQKVKYKFLVCGNHDLYFSSLRKSKKDELTFWLWLVQEPHLIKYRYGNKEITFLARSKD